MGHMRVGQSKIDISCQWAAIAACGLLASLPVWAAWAADAPPGATMCSGCHARATNVATSIPVINGRDAIEITTIMEEFRRGKRPATVMDRITRGFAPDEVQAIAAWLAEQK